MCRGSQSSIYMLVYVHLSEQYGTKVPHASSTTPPWLPIWNWATQTPVIYGPNIGHNSNNPHQSQGFQLTQFLRFHIPALQCRPVMGWATPSVTGFTYSRLCNGHSLELLVLCKYASPISVADTRPPRAKPLVGALQSCSRVFSWAYLRLPKSHWLRPHSQTHIGVFLQVYPVGWYLAFTGLRIH
jgi:hypothetical protein